MEIEYMSATLTTAPSPPAKDLPGEIWRPIEWVEGYFVSNCGRIKNKDILLKQTRHDRYMGVNLRAPTGGQKTVYVHHLVCAAFHGEKPPGAVCAFKDGNRDNITADNLHWRTRKGWTNVKPAKD